MAIKIAVFELSHGYNNLLMVVMMIYDGIK